MKNMFFAIVAGMAIILHGGCAWFHKEDQPLIVFRPATDLITTHYGVADGLRAAMIHPELAEHPLLMASFVPLDDLDQTSPLGRVIPQQIGSRLVQHGIQVVDVRLRSNTLLIRDKQGEFALSRELHKINQDVNAYSVLTGTYTVVYGNVYVTAMILRAADGAVLAALDYTLPVDRKALAPDTFTDTPSTAQVPLTRDQLPDPRQGMIVPSVMTRL
jgi:TolB-like protein